MNKSTKPSREILEAFGITDEPELLKGGQGTSWKAGKNVIKPISTMEEVLWAADIIENLPQDFYRIPRFKRTNANQWVYKGWAVNEFIEGSHIKAHWKEKIEVCKGFSKILEGISKPDFIDKRTDPWSIAGKMAWQEIPLDYDQRLSEYVKKCESFLKPITVINQIIHGDITGNMLFNEGLIPGVIDFTPTWRPKEYALAILVVDAFTWENADRMIFQLVKDEKNIFQLLLRAALFRTLVLSEFYKQHQIDRIKEIDAHKKTLEVIIEVFK